MRQETHSWCKTWKWNVGNRRLPDSTSRVHICNQIPQSCDIRWNYRILPTLKPTFLDVGSMREFVQFECSADWDVRRKMLHNRKWHFANQECFNCWYHLFVDVCYETQRCRLHDQPIKLLEMWIHLIFIFRNIESIRAHFRRIVCDGQFVHNVSKQFYRKENIRLISGRLCSGAINWISTFRTENRFLGQGEDVVFYKKPKKGFIPLPGH